MRVLTPLRICSPLLVAVAVALLLAAGSQASVAKDGHGEVRAAGVCGDGAAATLRLRSRDDGIELRFEVDESRAGVAWRVVLVHERRIAWRGAARTARAAGSFEVRRTLPDLPGADAVTARAWGPRGIICRADATLPEPDSGSDS